MTLKNRLYVKKELKATSISTENDIDLVTELKPETALEQLLLQQDEFVQGLLWGKPRYGHPEGQIYKHIQEVFQNINKIAISEEDRNRLRIITLAHDTFKYKEHKGSPRDWSKHHSILARKFLEQFCEDQIILEITELHDEAYYCWRAKHLYQKPEKGAKRLSHLLNRLGDNLQLYYLFFKCDTMTGDKNQAPLNWFESSIPGINVVDF